MLNEGVVVATYCEGGEVGKVDDHKDGKREEANAQSPYGIFAEVLTECPHSTVHWLTHRSLVTLSFTG